MKPGPESRRTRTLAVSDAFADMITTLARAQGLSVEAYCDRLATPKFAPEYETVLNDKINRAKQNAVAAAQKG